MAELSRIHEALERARASRAGLRPVARAALGLGDHPPPTERSFPYPLLALSLLGGSARLDATAYLAAAPEIGQSLGVGPGFLGALLVLHIIVSSLWSLMWVSRLRRRPRSLIAIIGGAARSTAVLGCAFVASGGGLLAIVLLHAAASGTIAAAHPSLITETYPPGERVRRLGMHRLAMFLGAATGPPLLLVLTLGLGLTWRAGALVVGLLGVASTLFAVRLREQGYGRWEAQEIASPAGTSSTPESHPTKLRLSEALRVVMAIPSVRRLLAAVTLYAAAALPGLAAARDLLQARWNTGPPEAGLALGAGALCAAVGVGVWTRLAGPPAALLTVGGRTAIATVFGGALAGLAVAFPSAAGFALAGGLAAALLAPVLPAIDAVIVAAVAPGLRPHGAAMAACFAGAIGAPTGLLLLGTLPVLIGPAWSLAIMGALTALAGFVLSSSKGTLPRDLELRADEAIEIRQVGDIVRTGTPLPMLTCHGIDAAYEGIPVLFEVDFLVEEGEAVCLLGTNGAGKSTLLRAVAGLLPPSRGTIRFDGEDVAGLEADRLVRRGIVTIPPGRSVFGSLSVRENLQAFGHTFLEDRPNLDRAVNRCLEMFPILAARSRQRASTLSGGERQMLALAKAFVLRPRLLLIDELTLGLAPGADVNLYAAVRTLADSGTAVVMVEQSVNVSLSLANRAYFMEQGRVRFQGSPEELLERSDLLRPVFLGGAVKGITQA